jgi:hypothetical protein
MVDQSTKPRVLRAAIAKSLPEAERTGVTSIPWSVTPTAPPSVLRLAAAGVRLGTRFETGQPGLVSIAWLAELKPRPAKDPNHLVTAVDEALVTRHRGDVDKLMRAQVRERHLFMWVSPMTRLDVLRAMGEGIPTQPPDLPTGITDLWVGADDQPTLHWSAPLGWIEHRK